MRRLRLLITVKTYPIPSKTYDELVCTAGVTDTGEFIRLYPINFREMPFSQQYRKYEWIEVDAVKHTGRDSRKESWRPDCDTLRIVSDALDTGPNHTWSKRGKYLMPARSQSMEDLYDQKDHNNTSLGFFRPKTVHDLIYKPDTPEWPARFREALKQARLWETRTVTKTPPRKVPWKFQYQFECDDPRCKGRHKMMIEDWEVGALYWRLVDRGMSSEEAAEKVREKFMYELCGPNRDTHFLVGTVLAHGTWVIIGVYWPRKPKDPFLFS